MTVDQRKVYVKLKSEERKKIQAEILNLNKQRQQYFTKNTSQQNKDAMLDATMIKSIKTKRNAKNLKWE